MAKDFDCMEDSNPPSIHEVSDQARRVFLAGRHRRADGGRARALAGRRGPTAGVALPPAPFTTVPASEKDTVVVPEGYAAVAFAAWVSRSACRGTCRRSVGMRATVPPTKRCRWACTMTASTTFPLDGSSTHGLLVMNHEYTDDGLRSPDGKRDWTAEPAREGAGGSTASRLSKSCYGTAGGKIVRPSTYARATHGAPPRHRPPVGPHALMKTAADPDGRTVLGTLNNCGAGLTPWARTSAARRTGRSTSTARPSAMPTSADRPVLSRAERRWSASRSAGPSK